MSFTKLNSDLIRALSNDPSGLGASTDIQKHANDFSDAVDNYVKTLNDPGLRKVLSTTKTLIYSQIISLLTLTDLGSSSLNASQSALKYATGLNSYISAIQISKVNVTNLIAPAYINPGIVSTATLTNNNIISDLQNSFKNIFDATSDPNSTISIIISSKASQIANIVKDAVIQKTLITISGNDSTPTPLGPKPFTLSGKFVET
jgi:hypothetical protein